MVSIIISQFTNEREHVNKATNVIFLISDYYLILVSIQSFPWLNGGPTDKIKRSHQRQTQGRQLWALLTVKDPGKSSSLLVLRPSFTTEKHWEDGGKRQQTTQPEKHPWARHSHPALKSTWLLTWGFSAVSSSTIDKREPEQQPVKGTDQNNTSKPLKIKWSLNTTTYKSRPRSQGYT